ncbi:hypothetical protein PINS_up008591 [Pythium insidiosum]|nr:hypothetical protein PINS_up008591 [Pythium insidiosum]
MDPYELLFASESPGGSTSVALSSSQWSSFLSRLVHARLLTRATAARFATDHNGPLTLQAFQRQLVAWSQAHDPRVNDDDTFAALDTNIQLLEQLLRDSPASSPPSFVSPLVRQQDQLCDALLDCDDVLKAGLTRGALLAQLSRQKDVDPADSPRNDTSSSALRFQRENRAFLLREERRRRPKRVERLPQDQSTALHAQTLFPPHFMALYNLSVSLGTMTADKPSTPSEYGDSNGPNELVVVVPVDRDAKGSGAAHAVESVVAAYRELALSPYIQQYIGSCTSSTSEKEEELHCFELVSATTLDSLLQSRGAPLAHDSVLLRWGPTRYIDGNERLILCIRSYLSREILLAMIDLHEQSTHALSTVRYDSESQRCKKAHALLLRLGLLFQPLQPSSVFVTASGRRVLLGRLEWGPPAEAESWYVCLAGCFAFCSAHRRCSDIETLSRKRETRLLRDLAVLLYAMAFQATLPGNREDLVTRRLAWKDATFVGEFLIDSATPRRVVVPPGDAFELVPVVGGFDRVWRAESVSAAAALSLIDQQSFPVSAVKMNVAEGKMYWLSTLLRRPRSCFKPSSQENTSSLSWEQLSHHSSRSRYQFS